MRERHECHCMLFLTEDNDFVGTDKNISFDEVQELSAGFGTWMIDSRERESQRDWRWRERERTMMGQEKITLLILIKNEIYI